jgi:transcriptional regulator of NAD metabolism
MRNTIIKNISFLICVSVIIPLFQGCFVLDSINKPHNNIKKRSIMRRSEQKQEKEQPEKTGTTTSR